MKPITDLRHFMDIDREDIIKQVNVQAINSLEDELFNSKVFNKQKCNIYRKCDSYALNVLRGMCKEVGVLLKFRQREMHEPFNGRSVKYTHTLYSIYH